SAYSVASGPRRTDALPDPEYAECAGQNADRKFQSIFRDARNGPMQRQAEPRNQKKRDARADCGGKEQRPIRSANCEDDENNLDAFDHRYLKRGGQGRLIVSPKTGNQPSKAKGLAFVRGVLVAQRNDP